MKRFALVWLFVLGACVTDDAPPVIPDQRAINVAIEAWEDAGLPWTEKCSETRKRIIINARPDVHTICEPLTPNTIVLGCFIWPTHNSGAPPLIVVTTDLYRRADTMVHEAMHWLQWCAFDFIDSDHEDPMIWEAPDGVLWDALSRVVP